MAKQKDASTSRNAEQSVVALDIIALVDTLKIEKAILAGYDWRARAAYTLAALFHERLSTCKHDLFHALSRSLRRGAYPASWSAESRSFNANVELCQLKTNVSKQNQMEKSYDCTK